MNFTFSFFIFLNVISASICRSHFLRKRDAEDDENWSKVVGDLVKEMAADLLEKEGHYIDVDDFSDTFGGKILGGKILATGGSIGNLSTLNFVNLTVSSTPDSLTVFVQVKLDHLQISYSHFEASVRILNLDGSFDATVGSNLLTAQVTLKMDDDDCEAALEILELSEFGEIDLTISGVEFINEKFVNKIASMLINKFTPELKPLAEEKIRELVLPYVSLACEYWS